MATRTRKPAKPFVLKNIKAKELQELLELQGACEAARNWAAKKSLKQVFKSCNRGAWLCWLLYKMTHSTCWVERSTEQIAAWGGEKRSNDASIRAGKAYDKARNEDGSTGDWASKVEADVYRQHYTVA